jgi:hypothetical protein
MTAEQARQLTDKANSQSGELAIIHKKIEKRSLKGYSWLEYTIIQEANINILKTQGYDVSDLSGEHSIEW